MTKNRTTIALSSGLGTAVAAAVAVAVTVAACGQPSSTAEPTQRAVNEASQAAGIRVVDTAEAAAIHQDRAEELVVLDVRTAEEFAGGHLDGAVMIDFYAEDFADQLANLDPDASYLLYCRSGNRSGQTRAMMEELGFTDVSDIEGGIIAWNDAGLPLIRP